MIWDEWEKYRKSGKKPENIPSAAPLIYKEYWIGFPDWLGYEETDWSVRKVKELLCGQIESNGMEMVDDLALTNEILKKGRARV
jgi:hypothetical protein